MTICQRSELLPLTIALEVGQEVPTPDPVIVVTLLLTQAGEPILLL